MSNWIPTLILLIFLTACATANSAHVNETLTSSPPVSPTATTTHLPTETTPTTAPTITPTFTPKPTNDPGFIITLGEKISSPWSHGVPLFSPDGRLIALASSHIRFWNTQTNQLILELENPYSEACRLESAAFSDDGEYFAVSLINCWEENEPVQIGHLLVWNLPSGNLIHDWDQEEAFMVDSRQGEFSFPVYALIFLPNSTKLAYATGNSIAIRDVKDIDVDPEMLSLGTDMYATEISVRDDSEYLFVLMEWEKWRDFPGLYRNEYRLQSWHLDPNYLNFERGYPDVGPADEHWSLHKDNLLHYDHVNRTLEVRNLTTNAISQFPYLIGWEYFDSYLSLMINIRLIGFSADEQSVDLWNPNSWMKLYSFFPDFWRNWHYASGFDGIIFSPDNTTLAIAHNEQVTLWNINSIVNSNPEP